MTEKPTLTRAELQARRQIRRARQREANIIRAEKMHKARLTAGRQGLLPGLLTADAAHTPRLNVGCSGWFYWHWRGAFYPKDIPTKQWFAYYADHFRTVELNAPFYSWPTVATVQSWRHQAIQKNFVYTIKVCELITHIKRFQGTKRLIADFCFIADLLGPMMGASCFNCRRASITRQRD